MSFGIYRVTHHGHRQPHDVFAVIGDTFPSCRKCGRQARFAAVEPSPDTRRAVSD